MKRIFFSIAAICSVINSKIEAAYPLIPQPPKDETIVCLHGFLRTRWSMNRITRFMQNEGYRVVNDGYPSRTKTIEQHAIDLNNELKVLARHYPGKPIHFITHSMGALVARAAINLPDCPEEAKTGKAILFAPPNQGSAFGRSLNNYEVIRWAVGDKSGKQLIETKSFEDLGEFPSSMHVLVIAGQYDNKVSLSEAKLEDPHTFIVIPRGHSLIMYDRKAIRLAKDFLQN